MSQSVIVQPVVSNVNIDPSTILVNVYGMQGNAVISGGATAFIGLSDVPNSYLGAAGQLVQVNPGQTGLQFFTPNYLTANQAITLSGVISGSGTTSIVTSFTPGTLGLSAFSPIAANSLIGNPTGVSATPQVISIGSGLSFSGGVLSASGASFTPGTDISITSGVISDTATLASITSRGNTSNTGIKLGVNANTGSGYSIYLNRASDSSPSGNFIVGYRQDNTSSLFGIDVNGNFTGTSFITTGGTINQVVSGTGALINISQFNQTFTSDIPVVLPSGYTLGKYINGQTIPATGKTAQQVITDIATAYLIPTFTSFSSSIAGTYEVGASIPTTSNFSWTFTNSSNIGANTLNIVDITTSTTIASNISIVSPATGVSVGTIANTSPISHSWNATAQNTQLTTFTSGTTSINSLYPYFWGISSTVPTAGSALLVGSNKVIASSSGALVNLFNNVTIPSYFWVAVPAPNTKSTWTGSNSTSNTGAIGGTSNLFGSAVSASVNSPTGLWSGISYNFYIGNYATTTSGYYLTIT